MHLFPNLFFEILLRGGGGVLRFADSNGVTRSNQVQLTISNWHGSVSGS
jgi:hypothetical protein